MSTSIIPSRTADAIRSACAEAATKADETRRATTAAQEAMLDVVRFGGTGAVEAALAYALAVEREDAARGLLRALRDIRQEAREEGLFSAVVNGAGVLP